ncbi:hypothetical protein [Vreelandella jeotgali]|nr:hypothetical protein [Halomonas jeotgali]
MLRTALLTLFFAAALAFAGFAQAHTPSTAMQQAQSMQPVLIAVR